MKIALIGYGKMGKAIEEIALTKGHEIVLKIGASNTSDFTKENIQKSINQISFSTDNKTVKTDFEKQFHALQEKLEEKLFALEKMKVGFQVKKYLEVRANAVLKKTEPTKKKAVSSKRDPILALKLRELRDEIRIAHNTPAFQIFTQE
mgnify:CR=1 FL=1